MYHEAYHQEAQRRQRVIERKHVALERLKEQYNRQVSKISLEILAVVVNLLVETKSALKLAVTDDFTAAKLAFFEQKPCSYKVKRDYLVNMFTKQVLNKKNKFDQFTVEDCR